MQSHCEVGDGPQPPDGSTRLPCQGRGTLRAACGRRGNALFALRFRIAGSGLYDFGWRDDVALRGEPLGPPVAPIASFDASPLSGPAPTQVAFAAPARCFT